MEGKNTVILRDGPEGAEERILGVGELQLNVKNVFVKGRLEKWVNARLE